MKFVALDIETTGLSPEEGHRLIEVACVEIMGESRSGRSFHAILDPERELEPGAEQVLGITSAQLKGNTRFADIAEAFLAFIGDAPLVCHNAEFDLAFMDNELCLVGRPPLAGHHPVIDILEEARSRAPGVSNGLDALCKRYGIDAAGSGPSRRDAELIADVYLGMRRTSPQ
jgi:DNA polymerase-3 subunit epsilon